MYYKMSMREGQKIRNHRLITLLFIDFLSPYKSYIVYSLRRLESLISRGLQDAAPQALFHRFFRADGGFLT